MASASTSDAVESESDDRDFTDAESEEEGGEDDVEWIKTHFFPVEHVLDDYKSQDKRAITEPVVEDPTHKKLSSAFLDNLKLQTMQYVSFHSDLKNVKDEIEHTKSK